MEIPRPQSPDYLQINRDLLLQNGHYLLRFITSDLRAIEDEKYGLEGNTAYHKLAFLIGGDDNDVTTVEISGDSALHDKTHVTPKAPEISEATVAISNHFEIDHLSEEPHSGENMARVISEVSDVIFNIAMLTEMDNQNRKQYKTFIRTLCESLGMDVRQGLLLASAKYNQRLVIQKTEKDIQAEDGVIKDLMERGIVPAPDDNEIAAAYRIMNQIGNGFLRYRFRQLEILEKWKK